jgi:RHS repeat-associated protein
MFVLPLGMASARESFNARLDGGKAFAVSPVARSGSLRMRDKDLVPPLVPARRARVRKAPSVPPVVLARRLGRAPHLRPHHLGSPLAGFDPFWDPAVSPLASVGAASGAGRFVGQSGPPPPCTFGVVTNTGPPTLSAPNPTFAGNTITSTPGTWSLCGDTITGYHYEWLRNGVVITGAPDSASYTVQTADIHTSVRSAVKACDTTECYASYVQSSNAISVADRPNAPSSLTPVDGSSTTDTTPTLSSIYTDPIAESGYVSYSIYRCDGTFIATGSGPVVASGGASAWTVTSVLAIGECYQWYAQAGNTDGWSSAVVGPVDLYVPPSVPTLNSPSGGVTLSTVTPVSSASASSREPISYEFQVATDANFANVVADSGWQPTTSTWTVPPGLLKDGTAYYWHAAAGNDYDGATSAWSPYQSFSIRLPKLGVRDYWPIWSHGPLAVNEANGNLVVSTPGPSYPTSAGSMGASLTYNSQSSTNNGLGAGWALNVGDDGSSPPTKLIDHNASGANPHLDAVERISADGSSDYYTHVGSTNTYLSAPGDGSQLTKNAPPSNTWTLVDPDGAIYTFNPETSDGTAALSSAEWVNASPGKGSLTYAFSPTHPTEVDTITDDSGRVLNFNWANASDTGSCSGAILCVTGPDSVTWKYIGDSPDGTSGRLTTVWDGARNVLQFGYSGSSGPVTSVKNANDLDPTDASPNYNASHALTVAYDANSPARVTTVSDGPVTNQTPATSTWSFSYHPGAIQPPSQARTSHYSYLVRNDAPLAYYPLEETSGSTAADASGNGNSATYSGSYTLGQPGALAGSGGGSAVAFNGGIVSGSVSKLDLAAGGYNTVEMWVNWNGAQNEMPFEFSGGSGYDLWLYNGYFGFNSGHGDIWGTTAPTANTWHYIVAEFYNGSLTQSKLWVDGVRQSLSQVLQTGSYSATASAPFEVAGGLPFTGTVDEAAIYGYALSPAQIAAHFTEGMHEPAPAAYYPLDETSGTTAADTSGNGNAATYSGSYLLNQSGAYPGSGTSVNFSGGTVSGSVQNLNTAPGAYNTVELWVNWNGTSSEMPFGFGSNYDLYFTSGYFGFNTGCGDLYGTSAPSANTWHYVVAEFYNGFPQNGAKLWIDGVQQSLSIRLGTPCSQTVTSNFNISGWPHDGGYRMGGKVDEVAIYNIALQPTEITSHEGNGNRSGFSADGYTTLTPPNQQGQSCPTHCDTTYYDNLGHPIEAIDTLGRTSETSYNSQDQTLWTEDADGNPTDYLYGGADGKPSGNPYLAGALLQTIGPDPDGAGPLTRPVATNRYDETQIGTTQTPGPSLQGLHASYYDNPNLAGRAKAIENDTNVDFNWPSGPAALSGYTISGGFSVRWSGDLLITSPGAYTFSTPTSTGTRLTIDGTQAIDNWTTSAPTSQPITLSAGLHTLDLDYFSSTGSGQVHLHWSCSGCTPAIADQTIPSASLLPGWFNQTSTISPAGRISYSHFDQPWTGSPQYDLVTAPVNGTSTPLVTSYSYDPSGRIAGKVMPAGNPSPQFNASSGDLTNPPNAASSTYGTAYTYYDATGPGASAAPPNAPDCSGSSVNQAQQLKTAATHGEATTTYVYDAAGRTLAKTNGVGTTCSTYDSEGGLTSTQAAGEPQPTTYTYDPAGAQLTASGPGVSYLGEFGHNISSTNSLTKTITLTGAPGPGNAVFLRVANTTTAPGATAVTDSKGNTWTLVKQGTVGVPNSLYGTLQNVAPLASGDVVTVTWSTNVAGFAGVLDAFSGVRSLTYDQFAIATDSHGSTARNTGTTATTTQASELQIAAWGINAVETSFTPTTGASQFHTPYLTNSAQTTTEAEYKVVNATGAYNLNATGGVSGKYNGFIVTLPAVAASTTTTYYDEQGRLVKKIDSNGAQATYNYDADGNQVKREANTQTLTGSCSVATPDYCTAYNYDAADQLISETDPAGRTYQFCYDTRGNLRGTQYPSTNTTFSWVDTNPDGWITDQYNRHGDISSCPTTPPTDSSPLADYTYTYNLDGKRTSETRLSGSTSQTTSYSYDNLGRLSQVVLPDTGAPCRNYGYDLDSNRTLIQQYTTGCSGASTSSTYSYNPAATPGVDELTSVNTTNYAYTSDGQVSSQGTTHYAWDGLGRLKLATVGSNIVTYTYDPTGGIQTRASSSPASTINYLLDDLIETNGSGTIATSYADGPAGNLASFNGPPTTSSTPTYLYYDAHGNLAAEANTSGTQTGNHTYDPFGAPSPNDSPPANTTVHRFVGRWDKQYDTTTGDILMGARPYDPTIGRFLSVDPVPGGSLNFYDYAGQDPVNGYDLDGNCNRHNRWYGWACPRSIEHRAKSAINAGKKDLEREAARVLINALGGPAALVADGLGGHRLTRAIVASMNWAAKHVGALDYAGAAAFCAEGFGMGTELTGNPWGGLGGCVANGLAELIIVKHAENEIKKNRH